MTVETTTDTLKLYHSDGSASTEYGSYGFDVYEADDVIVWVKHHTEGVWYVQAEGTNYTHNATTKKIKFDKGALANISGTTTTGVPNSVSGTHNENIIITRTTDRTAPKANFSSGNPLSAADLNNNQTQNLYAITDLANLKVNKFTPKFYGILDCTNKHIKNVLDPTDDQHASTKKYVDDSLVSVTNTANAALPKAGGTMTGDLTLKDASPSNDNHAARKKYVDDKTWDASDIVSGDIPAARLPDGSTSAKGIVQLSDATNSTSTSLAATANAVKVTKTVADNALPKAGGTMEGAIAMGTSKITGLGDPTADQDAATKKHVSDNYYNKTDADARYYNIGTTEEIVSGETWVGDDAKVATTKAIDNRVVDLIDDVGGFVALTNEAAIPTDHPEKANETTADRVGTIISIGVLSATYTPSGGTCTIPSGTLTNHSVNATITDCGSTTLSAGFGVLVETTAQTDAQYAAGPAFKFHRLTPKATEVTTVAGKATEITTCHNKSTEITTCHNKSTEITTCHNKSTEITTCHTNATDIETVADNITDVSNFADLYQINSSAPSTDGGGNSLAAGDLWYDSSSNKQLKVYSGSAFQAVSPTQAVLDDIAIVSGDLTRQEDLGNVSDALASATTTSDLATVADNITDINTFKNVYRIASSAPSSSLDEGDLWYDSTANTLKYYNGTAWTVTAAEGLSALSGDENPQLANDLDCNNKNLNAVATVSGNNLQIDFGTIA